MSFVNTRAAASFVYIAFPLPATMLTAFARYLLGFDYIWGLVVGSALWRIWGK